MSSVSLRPVRAIALVLPLFALAACGGEKTAEPAATESAAAAEPAAPSSEWVQQNPTEAAVPVQVPDTPMTNAPATPAAQ